MTWMIAHEAATYTPRAFMVEVLLVMGPQTVGTGVFAHLQTENGRDSAPSGETTPHRRSSGSHPPDDALTRR
jgi:hypothetical protein